MSGTLVSPGVKVTVIDDSFYVSGGQGTVPLIFIGTHEYKVQPNGTSVATGTLPENANTLYLITSQRELLQTFGNPVFYTQDGTPMNGYELNEYGLHAAYQYLGSSNTAFVIRAPIDYTQLKPSTIPPVGEPMGGTQWLDTSKSNWGVFMSNGSSALGSAWNNTMAVTPIVSYANVEYDNIGSVGFTSTSSIVTFSGTLTVNGISIAVAGADSTGSDTLGSIVANINNAFIGESLVPSVTAEARYIAGANASGSLAAVPAQYYLILRQSVTNSTSYELEVTATSAVQAGLGITNSFLSPIQAFGATQSFAVITLENDNVIFQKLLNVPVGVSANTITPMWFMVGSTAWSLAAGNGNQLYYSPHYQVPGSASGPVGATTTAGNVWIKTTTYNSGANLVINTYNASTGVWQLITAPYYASTAAADLAFGTNKIVGSVFTLYNVDGTTSQPIASQTPYIWDGANWNPLVYSASPTSPTTAPESGTYWFMDGLQADIMINTGEEWVGYTNSLAGTLGIVNTDPLGVIIAGSAPTKQTDNTPLVAGDLWINSSDMENYPKIYRYNTNKTWTLLDNTDDTTPYGIIFADARWSFDGTIASAQFTTESFWFNLAKSNYVDPDAPDPRMYPAGMLLFNTRIASQNVKQWNPTQFLNGFNNEDYTTSTWTPGTEGVAASYGPLAVADVGRWVTVSGNNLDGSPKMGRKAQRAIVVQYLAETTNNLDLLSEAYYFNLIACPGYIELVSDMVTLNNNKANLAFVVGDTPVRLDPSGTSITNFAINSAATDSETAIVTADSYLGMYYPWGISTNVDGTTIVIPPSTTMLQVIAYSDSISYVWMPPAGYTRGLVSNASNVGYIDSATGNFKTIQLNQGQRDVLYSNNINPIAYIPGRGLVVYGQKTRDPNTTAMDRVNVSRLVNYLRYNFDIIAKPFLFELNTENIRAHVTTVFNTFLTGVMANSGVYNFIVVCDTTNNTPSTIDANELWIDIAIQPAKAIEFIYIPLRLVNTGTDMSSLYNGQTAAS